MLKQIDSLCMYILMYVLAYPLTIAFSLLMYTSADFESWYSGCMRSSGDKFGTITTKIRTKLLERIKQQWEKEKKDRDQRLKKLAEEEEKEASVTALWESAKIDVDQARKVQPDKRQLLLDLKVTAIGVCPHTSLCFSFLQVGPVLVSCSPCHDFCSFAHIMYPASAELESWHSGRMRSSVNTFEKLTLQIRTGFEDRKYAAAAVAVAATASAAAAAATTAATLHAWTTQAYQGLDHQMQAKLESLFRTGLVQRTELDAQCFMELRQLPKQMAIEVVDQFSQRSIKTDIRNKTAFFLGIVKSFKNKRRGGASPNGGDSYRGGGGYASGYGQWATVNGQCRVSR